VKILVCGTRDWTDRATIRAWLARCPKGTVVVHGAARGADEIAGEEAATLGFEVRPYPAAWKTLGNAAGPERNQRMLDIEEPDAVLAFTWALTRTDIADRPTGTGDMVLRALAAGVRVTIVPPKKLTAQSLLSMPGEP
jgi:hypothetical protein